MTRNRLLLGYGAELYNFAVGMLALAVLGLLALAGAISTSHWLYWSALSSSFVFLPLGLVGLRRLFPTLSEMMEIKGRQEQDVEAVAPTLEP